MLCKVHFKVLSYSLRQCTHIIYRFNSLRTIFFEVITSERSFLWFKMCFRKVQRIVYLERLKVDGIFNIVGKKIW